jgi:hypothetical protein
VLGLISVSRRSPATPSYLRSSNVHTHKLHEYMHTYMHIYIYIHNKRSGEKISSQCMCCVFFIFNSYENRLLVLLTCFLSTQWQMGHLSYCGTSLQTFDRSPCTVLSSIVSYLSSIYFKCNN